MEARLITAVKELARCLMSLWRKLAYDLAEDMHIPSEPNNRNLSAVKMAYQFNVKCDLFLWNAESKIEVERCILVLRTAFSLEGSDVLKKNWHTQTHNLPTNINHHTAAVLNTVSLLCDGIQCRLTARTAGSAKGEILASVLGNKQTDKVNTQKSINRGHNNKLLSVSDTEQVTLCIIFELSQK